MAFASSQYVGMYKRFLGPMAQPVILQINNGAGFDSSPAIQAYVTNYRESDLVQGGSIQIGDLKVIIVEDYLPAGVTTMGRSDRIQIDGRNYSVIHWDAQTRAMGADVVAIEVTVRG